MHGATLKVTEFRNYRKVRGLHTFQLVVKFTAVTVVTVKISVSWRMM